MRLGVSLFLFCAISASPASSQVVSQPLVDQAAFRVRFDKAVFPGESFTGRIYVAFSTRGSPASAMHSWSNPPPLFAIDVEEANAGDVIRFADGDKNLLHHPVPLSEIPEGDYQVQAIARVNLDSAKAGTGEGDLLSPEVTITWPPDNDNGVEFVLTKVVEARAFPESEHCKLFEFISPSLSDFHGRDIIMRAGVVLPKSFDQEPDRTFPVVYDITGFGGSHYSALRKKPSNDDVIFVIPDATCYWGHNVFADSATNGPWGHALVHEFIPALEAKFRGAENPSHRYTTGVSSGGWSCLWLQVTYPDSFNGCFSHVPDPVDFRDFQRANLYDETTSLFYEIDKTNRPLARNGDVVMIEYKPFVDRETILGPGGQIRSFEACFSPVDEFGLPMEVFDRQTGVVDIDVAAEWEKYDINLVLERNWESLEPKLRGKLHIWAGEFDTFYLEGAVRLLKVTLNDLESDAVVEIVPGMPHTLHRPGHALMMEKIRQDWKNAHPDG